MGVAGSPKKRARRELEALGRAREAGADAGVREAAEGLPPGFVPAVEDRPPRPVKRGRGNGPAISGGKSLRDSGFLPAGDVASDAAREVGAWSRGVKALAKLEGFQRAHDDLLPLIVEQNERLVGLLGEVVRRLEEGVAGGVVVSKEELALLKLLLGHQERVVNRRFGTPVASAKVEVDSRHVSLAVDVAALARRAGARGVLSSPPVDDVVDVDAVEVDGED